MIDISWAIYINPKFWSKPRVEIRIADGILMVELTFIGFLFDWCWE